MRVVTFAAAMLATGVLAASASAAEIPDTGTPSIPEYQGAPAVKNPLRNPTKPGRNPHMAPNPDSNIHNDTWMTDAYNRRGPLGRDPQQDSYSYPSSLCGSLAFDSEGRIVTVCPSIPLAPQARIIDPETLAPIDTLDLPNAANPPNTKPYQNFSGGGYFFLDDRDRMWIPTKTDHILRVGFGSDGDTLTIERDYDLTGALDEDTERITSALPDYDGLIWFVSKQNAKIGTLDPKTGEIKKIRLDGDEEIENSFSVASDGVYVVSNKRMYRLKARNSTRQENRPRIVWQARYPNSGIVKPSQVDAGSGTTPTNLAGGYVAITDNADPMHVVVYRTANELRKNQHRVVCKVPVFKRGRSATENSLIGSKRSVIVENNYGYQDPFGPDSGAVTEAGFARVDVDRDGRGCSKRWTNEEVRSPTVVPKMSTKTGLIYTYSRPDDPLNQGYFWTAIDYRTGATAWMQYAGSGLLFNNNYAGLALGPDGTAYLGVIGGMIALRDGE
ncbi:MAG: hypothetical protein R2718_05050 [Solirubrobacterales bacterium]|nr:hypothetical protein [Solirubrobacterales bacterium]